MRKVGLFLNGFKSNACICCPKPSFHVLTVTLFQTRVTSALNALKKESGRVDAEKKGLRAIDLARREREKVKPRNQQRPETENLSPAQRRVTQLKQLSQQLQNVHPNVLAKALHKSITYQNQDFVVINKPYGVCVQDAATSVENVLPILAKMINGMRTQAQLHICHHLEKDTTGTLLLAWSEEVADNVRILYKGMQVERTCWAVAVGTPVPSEGVIEIPIIEREVTGAQPHFKMGLSPLFRTSDDGEGLTRVRANRNAHAAVTKYRVLDSRHGCSLVELRPVTAVKHQLRVHMAYALGCPILGDHKYAHWNKLAPQHLPERVLGQLDLEQSKTRHLPLHLHQHQLTLSGFKGQKDLTVSCRLPKFFISSVQRLQITLPEKKETES